MIKARTTEYKGIVFRSRLEAKWAAFFDELGWKWDYEPLSFDVWIPDFIIYGNGRHAFVEVKPVSEFPKTVARKVLRSGCEEEVLIVGISPTVCNSEILKSQICIGWLYDKNGSEWSAATFGRWGNGIGFAHDNQDYTDRISGLNCGCPSGDCYFDNETTGIVIKKWFTAANKIQWRKK